MVRKVKPVVVEAHQLLMLSAATGALTLQRGRMPMTVNAAVGQAKNAQQWARANEVKNWRQWAHEIMIASDGRRLVTMPAGPVEVRVFHLRKNLAAMPDVGAPFFAVKAVIDGLVDAGTLAEDGPATYRRLIFEAPRIVGWHGLRVVVTPLPDEPKGLIDETREEGLF